ncbi:phosphorus acquisition-controlling protein [Coccidioides immitis RMSCC 3703]|uniref:Phosphorus acquisition-controlling protein n=1 Tax=Coccidioides immitis RMSCC 3703 TaxID=454286 RepID=A0A0J8QLP9_COCIT|nr:phosphorus acquisition-controlling protein [Coccidioides immitis RMSCC 3703]
MNQDPSLASWSGHMPEDSLISGSSEDLSNLLDFDFDLADLGTPVDQHGNPIATSASQVPTTLVQDAQLTGMEGIQTSQPQQYATSFTDQMQSIEMQGVTCTQAQVNPTHFYLQKQHQHGIVPQGFGQPHQFVPPTPNSTELHGGVARYPPPLDTGAQRRYEPYTRGTDDQGAFTPLISPAMTPLEQQLRFPEYATPGEYLTPLTSPALEAHNHNGNGFMFSQTSGVDMGFVTSPVDARHQLPASTAPSSPAILRRHRRKSSIAQRSNARQVRQSPSMRPMSSRQKSRPGSAIIPGGDMRMWNRDLSQDPSLSDKRNGSRQSSSTESSGQDSVSPEPLSEPLMPPPALPRAFKSPYMAAQESSSEQRAREAATPATLMKCKAGNEANSSANFSRPGSVVISNVPEETMEDISLPEAASNVDQAATSTSNSRPGGRTSKKRQSGSTSQISPALRPKISPSIQPLIRAEGISSETSALYLASKSNYQHILEGTVLPGVSYPENLAENLSSKRTNHKLAEQGRRNRINTALKEIERLLPPSLTHDGNKDKDKDKAAEGRANGTSSKSPDKPASHQPISKASTVELAIVYIKALQQELAETKKQLKDLTTKLDGTENPNIAVEKVNSEKTATQPGKSDPEAPNATQKTTTAEEPNPENDESKAAQ